MKLCQFYIEFNVNYVNFSLTGTNCQNAALTWDFAFLLGTVHEMWEYWMSHTSLTWTFIAGFCFFFFRKHHPTINKNFFGMVNCHWDRLIQKTVVICIWCSVFVFFLFCFFEIPHICIFYLRFFFKLTNVFIF